MTNCIGCKLFGLCRITNKHAKIWCLQEPNWEPRKAKNIKYKK